MNQLPKDNSINRREFFLRTIKAGASIAAACSLSYWLYDSAGPGPSQNGDELARLPDFSIPGLDGKMSIVLGQDRAQTVNRGLNAIGGIEAFIKRGDRVLLKVNA
ncbi:MAG: DUF362 domain-containing protein, partial [Thermodesulfobacteriota bacterium]